MRKVAISTAALAAFLGLAGSGPPAAPRIAVTDTYHGVAVSDAYRWLENGADPEVGKWSDAQNAFARSVLDRLPDREAIGRRVRELSASPSPEYFVIAARGGLLFAIKREPPRQQPFLVALKSADDPKGERVLVDPNVLDAKGTTSIDWYAPSLDGKLVAVSLSEGGSESGTVHVFETATGKALSDVIPRGQRRHGRRQPGLERGRHRASTTRATRAAPSGRPRTWTSTSRSTSTSSARRRRTTSTRSGKDFPRIAEIELRRRPTTAGSSWPRSRTATAASSPVPARCRKARGRRSRPFADKVVEAAFGPDGRAVPAVPQGRTAGQGPSPPAVGPCSATRPRSSSPRATP